jgi:SAM-dependent methyltransferase
MDKYLIDLCNDLVLSNEIENKTILEVGSYNVNGSFRDVLMKMKPLSYIGVDITTGPYVDEICSIYELDIKFKNRQFDIVVCTEVIEHLKDWQKAIINLMNITKIDGIILLTSRSKGFGEHNFPGDFWRYEIEDIEYIFKNWKILYLSKDLFVNPNNQLQDHYGFFLKAKKINLLIPDLDNYMLYNIKTDPRHNPVDSCIKRTLNAE